MGSVGRQAPERALCGRLGGAFASVTIVTQSGPTSLIIGDDAGEAVARVPTLCFTGHLRSSVRSPSLTFALEATSIIHGPRPCAQRVPGRWRP